MNENPVSLDAVVGIDVAKKKVDVAAVLNGKAKSKVFDNTPAGHAELQRWLLDRGLSTAQTHVCMEATGPLLRSVGVGPRGRRLASQCGQSGTHQGLRARRALT